MTGACWVTVMPPPFQLTARCLRRRSPPVPLSDVADAMRRSWSASSQVLAEKGGGQSKTHEAPHLALMHRINHDGRCAESTEHFCDGGDVADRCARPPSSSGMAVPSIRAEADQRGGDLIHADDIDTDSESASVRSLSSPRHPFQLQCPMARGPDGGAVRGDIVGLRLPL
jgi:hypothetical protein